MFEPGPLNSIWLRASILETPGILQSGLRVWEQFVCSEATRSTSLTSAVTRVVDHPVYLPPNGVPEAFRFLGHGTIASLPVPLAAAIVIIAAAAVVFARTRFGRVVLSIGIQPGVVRYSGIAASAYIAATFVLVGLIAAVAGLILTSTVTVYIPSSGNAFLLNAIGATFIGTTLSPLRRPNVGGTVFGVLLLSIVANGLPLTDLNFYWQQVGTGTLIFAVLLLSFINRRATGGA